MFSSFFFFSFDQTTATGGLHRQSSQFTQTPGVSVSRTPVSASRPLAAIHLAHTTQDKRLDTPSHALYFIVCPYIILIHSVRSALSLIMTIIGTVCIYIYSCCKQERNDMRNDTYMSIIPDSFFCGFLRQVFKVLSWEGVSCGGTQMQFCTKRFITKRNQKSLGKANHEKRTKKKNRGTRRMLEQKR